MIANYADDPELFERCLHLIDEIFPGCREFASQGLKYQASWSELSTPFIVEEKGEIIAHAGVWPLNFMLNGKEHHSASIHGVCVKMEHRGKRHFQQLMEEVMLYMNKNFDSSVLFTVKPYLYKNYPYKTMLPEYDFLVNAEIKSTARKGSLRTLALDNADDLKLMHHLLTHRVPLSNQLSPIHKNAHALFIFNTLHKKIHYSEKLNLLLVYEIINKTLYLKEVISKKQYQISEIVKLIPEPFEKMVLQFCPDNFLDEKEYSAILAGPECCIMVSDKFHLEGNYFRYPELYWC